MTLIGNISLNIEKYYEMCQQFFFQSPQAAVSQRLNYVSCRRCWGEYSSQIALRRFTRGSNTLPSNWEGDYPSPPQRNVRRQCLHIRWCYDVPLGCC